MTTINIRVNSGDILGFTKLNDSFPIAYLPHQVKPCGVLYRIINPNDQFPEVDDVIEFESSSFAYQFSVTARFWVDLKTSKKSELKLINNKYKLVSINNQNEINNRKNNVNNFGFVKENGAMTDEGNAIMTGSNRTDNEMHKPTHESNKTENGDEATQFYGDQSDEAEYRGNTTTGSGDNTGRKEIIEATTQADENVLETAARSAKEIHITKIVETMKDDKLILLNSSIAGSQLFENITSSN